MCGIAGLAGYDRTNGSSRLDHMLQALKHRGPDDHGTFVPDQQSIALGHQRLAILDLSPLGHQPMASRSGRYIIVFNGEIYNFAALRQQLMRDGCQLTSHSDTEVILELYAQQGCKCVEQLEGMFAFAIWDQQEQELFCARDPLGIKPFYYWCTDSKFAFASEVRSLLQANLTERRLNTRAVSDYLLFGAVQEPETLVEGLVSLPAGYWLSWSQGQTRTGSFWQLNFDSASTDKSPSSDYVAITAQVREALDESIARHFVSDVPVGIFLSGGIDSTAVIALAHAQQCNRLQTFCISFQQPEFDEGELAQRTADHFQTEHHQWRMSAEEGRELFADFLNAFDLPSNDGFNTYCVSRFARRHGLKVVLSGLGGDELFGGYPSFQLIPKLVKLHRYTTMFGGGMAAAALARLPLSLKHQRLLSFLNSTGTPAAAHWAVRGFFLPNEIKPVLSALGITTPSSTRIDESAPGSNLPDQVAWLETTRYMRNQLLRDSDVMSMAVGLELRTPLVDRKLMDRVSKVPAHFRLQPGKRLLTDAVPEIPSWILNSPKRGFRFPFEDWLADQWQDLFASIEQRVPLKLQTWPRKWTLLLLEKFIEQHSIQLA